MSLVYLFVFWIKRTSLHFLPLVFNFLKAFGSGFLENSLSVHSLLIETWPQESLVEPLRGGKRVQFISILRLNIEVSFLPRLRILNSKRAVLKLILPPALVLNLVELFVNLEARLHEGKRLDGLVG